MESQIIVLDEHFGSSATRLREVIAKAAEVMGISNASCEAYIVGDSFMEKNVLAYPASHDFPRPDLGTVRDLGEMYINPAYITAHGEDFDLMAAHAFLHLLGHDHTGENDTITMEVKEREIMKALGKNMDSTDLPQD